MSDLETVMKKRDGGDLISELPQNIIGIILSKLPIVEAVRTSILSTSWKWKWTFINDLVFDYQGLKLLEDERDRRIMGYRNDRTVNFINTVLLLHDGSIRKCSISSRFQSSYIEFWLLFISRKGVSELVVDLDVRFKAPLSLFSCQNLCRLKLDKCDLVLPPNFEGFPFLKCLHFNQVRISTSDIENLISSCPLLESLMLHYKDDYSNQDYSKDMELGIYAPNLKHLTVEGGFKNIYLAHSPHLTDVSITMRGSEDGITESPEPQTAEPYKIYNFNEFIRAVPKLERLIGHRSFTKHMSMGADLKCCRFLQCDHLKCHHLKSIDLHVNFAKHQQVRVLLLLLVNSPNLEVLHVDVSHYSYHEYDPIRSCRSISESFMLHRLKNVRWNGIAEWSNVKNTIKFLLQHSPALEKMIIGSTYYGYREVNPTTFTQLLSYTRASPIAAIIFK